jgi:adenine-specific DNA-methyltransferase
VLTAKYEFFRTVDGDGEGHNPGNGFVVQTVPHVSLSAVSRSADLEPILDYHRSILQVRLAACNDALLAGVSGALRTRLAAKLREKERTEGKRSVTDAHRRRWLLPPDNRDRSPKARKIATVDLDAPSWYEWEVPFDTDPDWPQALQEAVTAYQKAWRVKMNEVNDCIAANAEVEALVDQPEVVKGVLRVSGPFTVEGVRPGELNLGEEGLFAGPPNKVEETEGETAEAAQADLQNQSAYLGRMVQLLRADGVTFPDNQQRNFARIEPLFESSDSGGSVIHAEGLWEGEDGTEPNHVGIGFGPQYGPVTAEHVEELIRASRRYDELVIGGFSFDAAASAVVQESAHPRLRIHQAYIRPDVNPGMDGLLKDTPNSQIFTVFGQPEIRVERNGNEWTCELLGVDIYDPLTSTVRSTGASKVAAWFVDQDYDGRCFCITQAFFPNENAWEKIAKTLGSSADPEAFAAFEGTVSLPFRSGRHRRIAVKVIDPRGNEVMTIQRLED